MNTNTSLTKEEFELFRELIKKNSGITLGDAKSYLVESRLRPLLKSSGCSTYAEFYCKVLDRKTGWIDKIIDAMTTNETLWFRDRSPFVILKEAILPKLTESVTARKIRFWSAGCSTGQEPYSIAMTIHEFCQTHPGIPLSRFEIIGTDISPSALFTAIAARYEGLPLSRGMDQSLLHKYFTKDGRAYEVKDEIKSMVIFKQLNLQDSFTLLGKFDVIFCRNVAIYFSDDFKRELFRKFYQALYPRGFFFLGSAENLRGLSDDFETLQHKQSYYYRAK